MEWNVKKAGWMAWGEEADLIRGALRRNGKWAMGMPCPCPFCLSVLPTPGKCFLPDQPKNSAEGEKILPHIVSVSNRLISISPTKRPVAKW
jgi:hypothetical protein